MTVNFIDVGRYEKNWILETDSLDNSTLIKSIRKHKALISRFIEIVWTESDEAVIIVGYHQVGKIKIEGGVKIL